MISAFSVSKISIARTKNPNFRSDTKWERLLASPGRFIGYYLFLISCVEEGRENILIHSFGVRRRDGEHALV